MKKIASGVLILVFFLLTLSLFRGIFRLVSSRDRIHKAQERLAQLQAEEEQLKNKLEEISSDTYKEEQIRDKLGLAKEGETIIVLPDEDVLRKLSPRITTEVPTDIPKPNWKKWADLFLAN